MTPEQFQSIIDLRQVAAMTPDKFLAILGILGMTGLVIAWCVVLVALSIRKARKEQDNEN